MPRQFSYIDLQQSRLTAKWMQFGGGALISRAALVCENPVVTTLIALRGATHSRGKWLQAAKPNCQNTQAKLVFLRRAKQERKPHTFFAERS